MIITLLTDFGTRDSFVGVMKGVIKSIAPAVDLIDLTHHVPPQDIRAGAFALKTAYRFFPPGTIHLAVVDPGVGSARLPIAARIGAYLYVCPDNGLLSYVLAEDMLQTAVSLDKTQYHLSPVSRTFHGRDIFAPVAAHLAGGTSIEAVGTRLETMTTFPLSRPAVSLETITCHVISIDTYGNVFTDLTQDIYDIWQTPDADIEVRGQIVLGPVTAYSDVPVGAPLALFGSSGHLEIAVRSDSARDRLGLHVGDPVSLRRKSATQRRTGTAP